MPGLFQVALAVAGRGALVLFFVLFSLRAFLWLRHGADTSASFGGGVASYGFQHQPALEWWEGVSLERDLVVDGR